MAHQKSKNGLTTSADGLPMNSEAILLAWRKLLPPEVCIRAGQMLPNAPPLTDQECASAGPVNQDRLLELQNSRMYAKQALTTIGCPVANLPVSEDRSPLWPRGIIGSITHTRWPGGGHVAVAVGPTVFLDAIGIDVEHEEGLRPAVWEYILTPREQEQIRLLSPEVRSVWVQTMWCVKEAIRKAVLQSIEPTSIEVTHEPGSEQYAQCGWFGWTRHAHGSPKTWRGQTIRSQGLVLATVVVLNHADSHKCF